MRFFATALPGLGPVLAEEVRARLGARPDGEIGFDGRNDVVAFEAKGNARAADLRVSEDVLVEAGSAKRSGSLRSLLRELWDDDLLARALSVYAGQVKPLRSRMSFRVVARVLAEYEFRRSELRDELTNVVLTRQRRWHTADPAELELWVLETSPRRFRLGLRLTTASMRHRGGRAEERLGALRPTVAAALVFLAGPPRGRLLDPFCGSGTILREAAEAGWEVAGSDLDPAAVEAARRNVPAGIDLRVADALQLPLVDESVQAVVANLPFGKEYAAPDDPRWFDAVLGELVRVADESASIVLLVPRDRGLEGPVALAAGLDLERTFDIRLLGFPSTVWQLRRRRLRG